MPIVFPTDAEIIAEEADRFRALAPEKRLRTIREMIAAGAFMMEKSPKTEFLREYKREQEDRARQAIKQFLARHAC
jgi:hypothetical protein